MSIISLEIFQLTVDALQWVYLAETVHQSLLWTGIGNADPGLMAEVVLRLANVYENSAQLKLEGEYCLYFKAATSVLYDFDRPL